MHLLPTTLVAGVIAWLSFVLPVNAVGDTFLEVISPTSSSQWVNGAANLVSWKKGLLDGVYDFDLELTRLSTDGLLYVAKAVPAPRKGGRTLNIYLDNVPAADDYFLLFLNTSHGVTYAVSDRFSILPSGTSPSGTQPKPDPTAPTVSVSGGPNPTALFATTFPASLSGAASLVDAPAALGALLSATLAAVAGGAALLML